MGSIFMGFAQADDPIVMTINHKNIQRSEFEYIYNKNNVNNEIDKKSLEDYVDLFVNFKLKVAAAEAMRLDTTAAFKREYTSYRNQLKKSYLTDVSAEDSVLTTVYNRLLENVAASHILIRVAPTDSKEKVEQARLRAEKARQRLLAGEKFSVVAKEVSEDPSVAQNGGSLGYFTALDLVKPFEDAAYALKKGEISVPIRTSFGFHIIQVNDRRADVGKVKVAHIFKHIRNGESEQVLAAKKKTMDSLYVALKHGADFATLAKEFSDDKRSAANGGVLSFLGLHQSPPTFEQRAFSLKINEISAPFRTPSGWHILKVLEHQSLPAFSKIKGMIQRRLSSMGRGSVGTDILVQRLKKEYHFQYKEEALLLAKNLLLQARQAQNDTTIVAPAIPKMVLLTIAQQNYELSDFIEWALMQKEEADQLLEKYGEYTILRYEDNHLEQKYPDFGNLMREYRDGILLFDISNQMVWDKANKDKEGLAAYFKANKSSYAWDTPHFRGAVLECVNKEVYKKAKQLIKDLPLSDWTKTVEKALNTDSVTAIKLTTGLFIKGDNDLVDGVVFKTGNFVPTKNMPYVKKIGKILKKGPQEYTDVRGPITSDYQAFLEKEWIKKLRATYPVKINTAVLKTVNNH